VPKVLLVGLDGGTWAVLEPLARAGRLPNLAALMARGAWGVLRSTVPALTLPAWASLATGRNPGAHGLFAFRRLAPDRYENQELADARALRAPTLWDIAGEAGLTVGVVNMPPSYPLRRVNGFLVGCMLTPSNKQHFTEPPEVAAELGAYRIDAEVPRALHPNAPDYAARALAYLDALATQTRLRTEAVLRVAAHRPCDLLAVVFYAPDRAQHLFWPYVTSPAESGNPEIAAAVTALYGAVDEAVGRLAAAAGPEATVIVVSDHGFGPAPTRLVRINRWLVAEGLLVRRPLWSLRRKIIRRWLPARFDTDDYILLDRGRSRAWSVALDGPGEAGVWVHVRGRYPLGCVEPGDEYESVRTRLVTGLQALRDEAGRPVFAGVWRREELYHGPYVAEAPDVVVRCNAGYAVSMLALRADLKATRVIEPFDSVAFNGHTGAHHPDGIYLVAGPSVAARGRQAAQPIEAIAPTVLYLLGLAIPRTMDAAPCTALLAPTYVEAHPVRYRDDPGVPGALVEPSELEADRAAIEDHLRALGYLA
jgi:predicted AlkP superfamily phosphohydrolase/phosphomutase